jgi:hypothetical protein
VQANLTPTIPALQPFAVAVGSCRRLRFMAISANVESDYLFS